MPVEVRRVRPEDWRAWKQIRLEALADTRIGFLELHEEAVFKSDDEWRERSAGAADGDDRGLWLAWDGERVVGCTGGLRYDGGPTVLVVAVYVSPPARGGEVFDLLLAAVDGWARTLAGVTELRLEVHEANARARAAYRKRGFVGTGATTPFPHDPPGGIELEMARPLRAP